MNKKVLTLLVTAALAAPTLASAKDFTGFGAAVELQLKSTGGDYTYTENYYEYSWSGKENFGGNQDTIATVNAWYGFNLTPTLVLQVGATYDLMNTETHSASYGDSGYSWSSKGEERNHYSIYAAPGYRVNPKTLVYGKLAYHSMKLRDSWSNSDGYSDSTSQSFTGWGLGGGLSTMLTDNIFVYAEAQRVWYGEETIYSYSDVYGSYSERVKPSSTIGAIGIGFNF